MDEFSIEYIGESIYHYKTKEYFQEIISSYNNENYRSAAVMLWSVAVIDLVFKLNDLVDLYNDKAANSILKSMKAKQLKDRKSSKWEHELILEVDKRTQLLNSDNIVFLDYLYQQRNLSAHPVLNANLELHRPNKATVRALIVNTINGILSKPPFFSKDIVSSIVVDLEASKEYLVDDKAKLKHYLESRFLSKMTAAIEVEVFKTLWKFVFKLEDEKASENRKINFQALSYLYEKNTTQCLDIIGKESVYFSDISKNRDVLSFLTIFLSYNTNVFVKLEKNAQILIDDVIENSKRGIYQSRFKYSSLTEFHNKLIEYIKDYEKEPSLLKSDVAFLESLSDSPEWESKIRIVKNCYYGESGSYSDAETRYDIFISPALDMYGKEELIDLITRANENGQIHGRSFNHYVNVNVKKHCDKVLGVDFDYKDHANFLRASTKR